MEGFRTRGCGVHSRLNQGIYFHLFSICFPDFAGGPHIFSICISMIYFSLFWAPGTGGPRGTIQPASLERQGDSKHAEGAMFIFLICCPTLWAARIFFQMFYVFFILFFFFYFGLYTASISIFIVCIYIYIYHMSTFRTLLKPVQFFNKTTPGLLQQQHPCALLREEHMYTYSTRTHEPGVCLRLGCGSRYFWTFLGKKNAVLLHKWVP